jgi:hypothetical protein
MPKPEIIGSSRSSYTRVIRIARWSTSLSEEVASTEAKQSSGGRGTTEYENGLAPRGASRHCNWMCAHYQRLLILFTCRIHMAVGDS